MAARKRVTVIFGKYFARNTQPVLRKSGLQARNNRSLDAHNRVSPARISSMPLVPLVRNACAADKCNFAVHYKQFPMRAMVDLRQQVGPQRVIPLHLAAGIRYVPEVMPGKT